MAGADSSPMVHAAWPKNFWQLVVDHLLSNREFLRRLHYQVGAPFLAKVTAHRSSPYLSVQVQPLASTSAGSTNWLRIYAVGYTAPANGDVVLCHYLAGGTKAVIVGKQQ